MKPREFAFAAASLLTWTLAAADPGWTLPLFTGTTGASCSSCHAGFSRLRAPGVAFLEQGHRDPSSFTDAPARTGMPLSILGAFGGPLMKAHGRPGDLQVMSAFSSRAIAHPLDAFAGTSVDSSGVRVDRAWLQLANVGPWSGSALRVGAFDVEPPFLSESRRSTITPYLAPVTIGGRGAEFRGGGAGGAFGAGLIESHRTLSTLQRLQDPFVWVRENWRGQDFSARAWWDRENSNLPQLQWLQHVQYQVAAQFALGRCEVIPSYMLDRFEDFPYLKNHDKNHYFLMEAFAPLDVRGRWSATARYEHLYHVGTDVTREEDRDLGVLDVAYQFYDNAELAMEWSDRASNAGVAEARGFDARLRLTF